MILLWIQVVINYEMLYKFVYFDKSWFKLKDTPTLNILNLNSFNFTLKKQKVNLDNDSW